MSRKKSLYATAAACVVLVSFGIPSARAQDWRRGEYEYRREPHRFGPLCEYGIRARGSAPVAFFGGAREVRKAEARSIRDWEFEASRLFGPRYGTWALAAGKELHCDARGLEFVCVAFAHPCRR
jgi:hypothetical protein